MTHSVNLASGPKSGFKYKCRARAGFGLQNEARLQLWAEQDDSWLLEKPILFFIHIYGIHIQSCLMKQCRYSARYPILNLCLSSASFWRAWLLLLNLTFSALPLFAYCSHTAVLGVKNSKHCLDRPSLFSPSSINCLCSRVKNIPSRSIQTLCVTFKNVMTFNKLFQIRVSPTWVNWCRKNRNGTDCGWDAVWA